MLHEVQSTTRSKAADKSMVTKPVDILLSMFTRMSFVIFIIPVSVEWYPLYPDDVNCLLINPLQVELTQTSLLF